MTTHNPCYTDPVANLTLSIDDELAEGLRGCLEEVIDWQEVFTLRLCGD